MPDKPKRILIVDDDRDCLANISDILSDIGYETVTATDGEIALSKLRRCEDDLCRFDLALLDFKMPGMDGAVLFRKLTDVCPDLNAIILTAYAGEDGVKRSLDAGTLTVLNKPVDIPSLLSLIETSTA